MPEVARGNATDSVASATGSGYLCGSPSDTSTDVCSGNVFANSIGVVREDDTVTSHTQSGCSNEAPGLSTYSPNVFANGKHLGRKGDNYAGDGSNIITSGSTNVFANS